MSDGILSPSSAPNQMVAAPQNGVAPSSDSTPKIHNVTHPKTTTTTLPTVHAQENVPPPPRFNVDALTAQVSKINIQDQRHDFVPEVEETGAHVTTEVVDWKKESEGLDKMFEQQALEKLEKCPPFERPDAFKDSVKLFPHQEDGIRWMLHQETGKLENPFIYHRTLKSGQVASYCRITKHRIRQDEPLQGSILADEMGLGKTIQTLGLIVSNRAEEGEPQPTLLVCPKSVASNWIQQAKAHLKDGELNIQVYEGASRHKMIPSLKSRFCDTDLLLVSYETLTADYKRKETKKVDKHNQLMETLMDVKFHRLVLDESHTIRNSKGQAFKAVMNVQTCKKLCLTGTPFVNKPEDIQSLLSVINLNPLSDKEVFTAAITNLIKRKRRGGLTRLRTAMSFVALRRTKRVTNIKLTNKTVQIRHVEWNGGIHQETHDALFKTAQAAFGATAQADEGKNSNSKFLFELVLRTRQACCHAALVDGSRVQRAHDLLNELDATNRALSVREGENMLESMLGESDAILDKEFEAEAKETDSPKICALLDAIKEMQEDEKGVIFSQFTTFLDIIESALRARGIKTVRIDGAKSMEERTAAMESYKNDDSVRFILCSLMAAGTGINLTRGNVVFMMDVWWNDAIENQSMDRVHRVGQERDVRCIRFIMKDSIESRFISLQARKAALGKGAIERLTKDEEKMAGIGTMRDLFMIDLEEDYDDWRL